MTTSVSALAQMGVPDIDPAALDMRDPFRRPFVADAPTTAPLGVLERFPVEEFKMVGAITGTGRVRAILLDPDGKTHLVSEKMRIGPRRGVIREIRANAVRVRELVVNALGREETVETEIRLVSGRKPGDGA
jgi:Tfp pilus assembly protein PilP